MPFQIIKHNEDLRNREIRFHSYGRGGGIRVCMVYPNTYKAGMSNLGFQTIFHTIASIPDVFCDRAFLPDGDILKLYGKSRRRLMALQSEMPLQDFHILAFSISFELDYLNMLKILELAGIPMRKEDRDEGSPLIIAGGAAVSINPEVISDFTDAFFIGEGEDSIKEFICLFSLNQNPGRDEILTRASEIDGVYVPEFYSIDYGKEGYMDNVHCPSSCDFPVKRRINPELTYLSHSVIISPDTEFADMHLIEIARGCPFSCGFCCVSLHNRPFRPASVDGLYAKIDEAMTETGRIGLMGAAVGSHPRFPDILRYIQSKGGNVGFSSLRADVLSSEVIRCLGELGQRVITLAPETGTDDLRKKLNKTLTNRSLLKTVDISLESGFREIRLYFMLGVPGETEDDIKAIGELIREVEGRAKTVGGRVFVSVNQLIPKPGTGLEMYPMAGEEEVLGRFKSVQSCFYNNPAVEFKMESPKSALVQAFLSRGSRKWGEYLLKFYSGSTSGISHMIMKHQKKDPSINKLLFSHIPTGVLPPWKIIQ